MTRESGAAFESASQVVSTPISSNSVQNQDGLLYFGAGVRQAGRQVLMALEPGIRAQSMGMPTKTIWRPLPVHVLELALFSVSIPNGTSCERKTK